MKRNTIRVVAVKMLKPPENAHGAFYILFSESRFNAYSTSGSDVVELLAVFCKWTMKI